MEKFLIINPFGIGDVLFTTPVINALKKRYPDCFIGYWCNERVAPLLRSNPYVDRIFAVSRGDIKRIYKGLKKFFVLFDLIRKIRKEKFNTTFDFSLDSKYGLWSKLAGINKRIGFDYKDRGRFLTDKVTLTGYSGKHVVEYYTDLLKFIGVDLKDKYYYLSVPEENRTKARQKLSDLGIRQSDTVIGIAMGGGASWGRDAFYKQWPAQKFGLLAGMITKEKKAKILLMGSIEEKQLAQDVIRAAGNDSVTDLTGTLGLEEFTAMIKELKLLICNDGGPLHMAVALGVSTVSVFGPVDDIVYGPYPPGEKHYVVSADVPCRPCYKNFRFEKCINDRRCLEDITVDQVYKKVNDLLCAAT